MVDNCSCVDGPSIVDGDVLFTRYKVVDSDRWADGNTDV